MLISLSMTERNEYNNTFLDTSLKLTLTARYSETRLKKCPEGFKTTNKTTDVTVPIAILLFGMQVLGNR